MMNKKGLSTVVATVLIVLLSLVAVTLLWTFIRGGIEDTSSAVDVANKCLNTEFKPTACKLNGPANTAPSVNATVQLLRGDPDGYRIILEDVNGNTNVSITQGDITTLQTATYNDFGVPAGPDRAPYKIKVAPVIKDTQGQDALCDPSPTVIECN